MNVNPQLPQSVFNTQSEDVLAFLEKPAATGYLHQHQVEAVSAARKQLRDRYSPNIALVVLPTGCGKTGVAVLASYVLNATRVLVITPSKTISKQIYEAFCGKEKMFLLKRNIIQNDQRHSLIPRAQYITKTSDIEEAVLTCDLMIITAHQVGGKSRVVIDDIPSEGYDLVIVDEAHHYPAKTWRALVDHFPDSRRLFLTATPSHRGIPILDHDPCYTLERGVAVERGIIRHVEFEEVKEDGRDPMIGCAERIIAKLRDHDEQTGTRHQALVLAQVVNPAGINPAIKFCAFYNEVVRAIYPPNEVEANYCDPFVAGTSNQVLNEFDAGHIRTLVIVGRLLEGYDNKKVSVVGIVRNVAPQSRVLFAQFVGRAVRKETPDDDVIAVVVSHSVYNQRPNFEQFDQVPDEDIIVVDEDD